MTILKHVGLLVFVVLTVASLAVVFLPFLSSNQVAVSEIEAGSNCNGISVGNTITEVAGSNIRSVSDFTNVLAKVKKGDTVAILASAKPASCIAISDGDIGFGVAPSNSGSGPQLGIDLGGGTTYSYRPAGQATNSELSNMATIIFQRAQIFGLQGVTTGYSNNLLTVSAPRSVPVSELLYPGVLDVRLAENIGLNNGVGKIPIGSNDYSFSFSNGALSISNQSVPVGGNFSIQNIHFFFQNSTGSSVVTIEAEIFNNSGILQGVTLPSTITYDAASNQYVFSLGVSLTKDASNAFLNVSRRAHTTLLAGQIVVDGTFNYYLDGNALSKIPLPSSFVQQPSIGSLNIIGVFASRQDANNNLVLLRAALQTGVLEPQLSLESQQPIRPTLFASAQYILIASLAAIFVLTIVVSAARYRNVKGGVYSFLLTLMEVVSAFGIVFGGLHAAGINLVVNYYVVLGLSAVGIFSALQYLTISEQMRRGKEFLAKVGYRKLFKLTTIIYLLCFITSVLFVSYFSPTSGIIVFIGLVIDLVLTRNLFERFAKKYF